MFLSRTVLQPRVLLIEDSEETLELSRLTLESQGCEVVGVSSAESALGLLNAGERFDLLFTDVCLGATSGIEAANRARAVQPQLPVLVTSGLDQHKVLPLLSPGIHFLPKPYTMSELLDAIRLCFYRTAEDHALAHAAVTGGSQAA